MQYKIIMRDVDFQCGEIDFALDDGWSVHSFKPCGTVMRYGTEHVLLSILVQCDGLLYGPTPIERKPIGLGRTPS